MKNDTNWYLVIGTPAVFNLISLFVIFFFYKQPSLINLLERDDAEAEQLAEIEMRKIYTVEAPLTY